MPRKYLPLRRKGQLKPGIILVDPYGNRRIVIKWIDNERVLLTHKNTDEPGSVQTFKRLAGEGDLIRQ